MLKDIFVKIITNCCIFFIEYYAESETTFKMWYEVVKKKWILIGGILFFTFLCIFVNLILIANMLLC